MSAPERTFRQAISAFNQRNLADAERLFKEVLRSDPSHVPALNLLSVVLMSTERFAEAETFITRAISLAHGSDVSHYNYGIILKRLNRPTQALQQFDKALHLNSDVPETWNNRGTIFNDLRQYKQAIFDFDQALALKPDFSEARANKGKALIGLKRYGEALAAHDEAIALNSDLAEAWLGRGTVLVRLKRFEEALAAYDKAHSLRPDLVEAWLGRGDSAAELKRFDEALAAYEKALRLKHDLAEAWLGRGAVLVRLKRFEEALAAYDKALSLRPDLVEAWLGRGGSAAELKRFDEALAAYEKVLRLKHDLAEAWLGRAVVLAEVKRIEEALAAYARALALKPDWAEAWFFYGNTCAELKQYWNAFTAFDRALSLRPDLKYAEGARLHTKMYLCNWEKIEVDIVNLLAAMNDQKLATVPFTLLSLPASPADQLQCAKIFVADQASFSALWRGPIYLHDRIRVAYLSADFRNHAVAGLTVGLFEHHDKSRFEVTGIAIGPTDDSPLRRRLENAFEYFLDASNRTEADIANVIRNREVDIVVDLMGHTQYSQLGILARRPAPIQVHYLGYPGTLGTSYIDYLLADSTVVPDEHRPFYSEHVVWLPDSYFASDNRRTIASHTPTRQEAGLPENGFVFCSFNNAYKITPKIFRIWLRLLQATPDSVLWLSQADSIAQNNLRREAERGGVSAQRLIFAPKLPEISDHLARHRLADLFLDTLPYNAHTTASDALWAGLPVLTCLGETFAGRVAASLLRAVGLAELVTSSLEDYETLALKLARDAARLSKIKDKLACNRDTYPLFNTARFTRHIEAAYTMMWQANQDGRATAPFAVKSEAEQG
jgi:predicted O-linked N-acetylglucosamine transferase (SPINDLY family)